MLDALKGYQVHVYERAECWEAVLTTVPKTVLRFDKAGIPDRPFAKRRAQELFAEQITNAIPT